MNPSRIIRKFVGTTFSLVCFFVSFAQALPTDKNQTLRINADKQEINLKDGVVIYSGDVKLIQGTLEITADKLTLHSDKNQNPDWAIAEGNPAKYQQQPEAGKPVIHAEANKIHYSMKTELLVLDKNVSIEQNGAITKAGHADYDIKSQTARFSKGDDNPSGRIETVIPPKADTKE